MTREWKKELDLSARGSNAIALYSAPSSCVVMNWAMSDPGTTTQRVSNQQTSPGCCQTLFSVAVGAALLFSSMGQFSMQVRSRSICPLQRRFLPCVSKKACTHFLPPTWEVSMGSSARLKQLIRDAAPFILDGGLATELEARGVSLMVRNARGNARGSVERNPSQHIVNRQNWEARVAVFDVISWKWKFV